MGFFDRLTNRSVPSELEKRDTYSTGSTALASLLGSSTAISEEKVMQIPTAEACINLIVGTIAQMPVYLYKEHADGEIEKILDDKRVFLLNSEPNELLTGFNLKKTMAKDYVLHGSSFVSVERTGNDILELYPLPASNITITKYVKDGYKVTAEIKLIAMEGLPYGGQTTREITFKPYDLMIALADSKDGITSIGLLYKGEKIFQQALDEMEYTGNIFKRGALPLGIIKAAGRLTQPMVDKLRESWSALYSGAKNSAKTVILEEGMEYSPLSMKPSDLQLNDSKSGTNSEIAKLFNVPESMITTAANKYGSIEQNQLHFLKHCLAPIIGAIESALDKSLLLESEKQDGYYFRFDTSEMLRATEKEKIEAVALGLEKGLFTINEARAKLDMSNIDEDVFMWGLQSVLYNPKTGEMKVPNMGLTGAQPNENQSNGGQTNGDDGSNKKVVDSAEPAVDNAEE